MRPASILLRTPVLLKNDSQSWAHGHSAENRDNGTIVSPYKGSQGGMLVGGAVSVIMSPSGDKMDSLSRLEFVLVSVADHNKLGVCIASVV